MSPSLRKQPGSKSSIFVKNVPAFMAKKAIPDLFARYNALHCKNVYPTGFTTTIVVSFQSPADAELARQETDGMRLENIILHVEAYDDQRSIRFLRDNRRAHRPLETTEDGENIPEFKGIVPRAGSNLTTSTRKVAGSSIVRGLGSKTWASVAANKHDLTMSDVWSASDKSPGALSAESPPPRVSLPVQAMVSDFDIGVPTSSGNIPPDFHLEKQTAARSTTNAPMPTEIGDPAHEVALEVSKVSSEGPVAEICTTNTPKKVPGSEEFIDTTERIRQKHCQGCSFCELRTRGLPRL